MEACLYIYSYILMHTPTSTYILIHAHTYVGKQIGQSIRDHTGSIRNICLNDSDGIITCANDGSIIVRYNDGMSITQVFHPPTPDTGELPFILDVTRVGTSDVVSCGEDGSLIVWRNENGDLNMLILILKHKHTLIPIHKHTFILIQVILRCTRASSTQAACGVWKN